MTTFELGRRERVFLYLCGIFLTALIIGDTIGSKVFMIQVPLGFTTFKAHLSVGAIWFPITFLLTDVINEFYGAKGARMVTAVGFWMAIMAYCVIWVARQIPAAAISPIPDAMFNTVFGNANRIFVASLIAYLVGQFLDISIFHFAKKMTKSRFIWLRSTGSTLASQMVDTVIVTYIAFGSSETMTAADLRGMALSSYAVKVSLAIGLTPVIYALHALLHESLGMQEATPEQ